ncbi:MAG: sigma-54-dependent Fis family transcriptional regulator [Acidobacteria bacterium]|nr:sigma-54-dependent Fis family transcriptional regulator [Acidobacteriota bacterium]
MAANASILVVDDEPSMLGYMRTLLELDSYRVETASNGAEAVQRVHRDPQPNLVLLDLLMPGLDGLETLEKLREARPGLRVVMLSCVSDTRKVVQAMRLGAQDYLTKPFNKAELDAVLRHCLGDTQGVEHAGPEAEQLGDDTFFVATTPQMRQIRAQVAQVGKVDVPVLMLGESGTGKEVIARLIHKNSARAHRTFLKVNCAAMPADLLESELFGYEPGAFTGATRSKPGKFELCNKGTILLDEIGEMPPSLQAKLLHVLQDQTFSRLGGRSVISVDVRILAATNIDVHAALQNKKLREDLYYRLNAFTITLPPLRDRKDEIPILLKHFMTRIAERYARPPLPYSPNLLDACMKYHWPGNVRELENFVKRYLILADEAIVIKELGSRNNTATHTDAAGKPVAAQANGGLKGLVRSLKDEAEAEAITRTLEQTNWNRKEAARLLNISYKALLYKTRQYGIEGPGRQGNRFMGTTA